MGRVVKTVTVRLLKLITASGSPLLFLFLFFFYEGDVQGSLPLPV